MVEFVRAAEDIVGAHQRVARMNFIPGGYKMPIVVREAHAEAESQLLASGEGDIETEPPSPTYDVDFRDVENVPLPPSPAEEEEPPLPEHEDEPSTLAHEDRPPSPREDDLLPARPNSVRNVSPHQDEGRPPVQETSEVRDPESPPTTDPQMLKLDIQKPSHSEELIQRVAKILQAPQPTSKGGPRHRKKKWLPHLHQLQRKKTIQRMSSRLLRSRGPRLSRIIGPERSPEVSLAAYSIVKTVELELFSYCKYILHRNKISVCCILWIHLVHQYFATASSVLQ